MIKASVAIQVLPQSDQPIFIVDKVIEYIKGCDVKMVVSPFETTIEGDYDKLMEIVKNCQLICVQNGAKSVMSFVKIHYGPEDGIYSIDEKIGKYTSCC